MVFLGSASSTTGIGAPSVDREDPVLALGRQLTTIRRRCARLRREYLQIEANSPAATEAKWQEWSEAIDVGLDAAAHIREAFATSVFGMVVKIEALLFELCDASGNDLDDGVRHGLKRLRRDLVALATRSQERRFREWRLASNGQ